MSEREAEVIARIRAVDEALARRGMSTAASERVRQSLARHAAARPLHARLRWWPMIAFAAGAALMAVLLVERRPVDAPTVAVRVDDVATPVAVAASSPPPEPACGVLGSGAIDLAVGECVADDGVQVSAWTPTTIERTGDRIGVREGEVVFEVEPRPGRPLHVLAGAIDIEVVGTRFVVHQRADGGRVSLLEGRLRVRDADGSLVMLERGQQLEWSTSEPRPIAPPSGSRHRTVAPPAAAAAPPAERGLAELLAEVATLRRDGRFQAAVDRLRDADASDWSERSRQLVSYEIGTLLERQLGDVTAACQHWQEHRRRFPGGLRDDIVARSIARLSCAAP